MPNLRATDVARAAEAMRLLVSPFDLPSVDHWRSAVNRTLSPLLGADSAGFLLPVSDGPAVYSDEHDPEALARYPELAPPPLSTGQSVFERAVELGVCTLEEVWGEDMHINLASEYFNDYVAPNHAHDALTAVLPLPRLGPHGMAGLQFWHESMRGRRFGPRETAILNLVFPALRAGVDTCVRWERHRADLLAALDGLHQPTLICDPGGRALHRTPALTEALAADAQSDELAAAMRAVALHLGRLSAGSTLPGDWRPPAAEHHVCTRYASYRVCGSLYRSPFPAAPALVLVALERTTPVLRSEHELRASYGFSRAECRVAKLLATSMSSQEVARELHLSPHTVRRHTESIFTKAGVNSRAALAVLLLR